MEQKYVIIICSGYFICSVIAAAILIKFLKIRFRANIHIGMLILVGITLFVAAYVFSHPFSWVRVIILAITLMMSGHAAILFIHHYLISPVNYIIDCLDYLTQLDFTKSIDHKTNKEFMEIYNKFNTMISETSALVSAIKTGCSDNLDMSEKLASLSGKMSDNTENASINTKVISTSAVKMSEKMKTVSEVVNDAAQRMNLISSAVEETTVTINSIEKETDRAQGITDKAVFQAMSATNEVSQLGDAAQEISKVTETISEISEQTNLLALNATIEAARAGETGKGFAVVAGEIKELARQTAEATQEIKKMIEGVQATSSRTVNEIGQITEIINEENEVIIKIAASVKEQSETTRDLAKNISDVSNAIQSADSNVDESRNIADDIAKDILSTNEEVTKLADSSLQVHESAQRLSIMAEKLLGRAGRFKTTANEQPD